MTTPPLPSPARWDHVSVFEAFLAKRSNDSYDPLSVAAARPYRSIWLSWCKHLATSRNDEITTSWAHAQSLDLFHYLYKGGISPAGNRRTSLSEISRWRYWSVINSIYEFAKNSGQVMRNPAEGMSMDDRPLLLQSEGQIFNVRDWKAIEAALPVSDSPTAIRDRALMMLIMDAALTTTEVTKLRIHDCTYTSNGFAVQITGSRGAQDRVLILAKETSEALSTWLGTRTKIQAHGIFADALFTTQKRGPIRPSGVYHIVDKTIRTALADGKAMSTHTGAQRLRNTRIVQWANSGVSIDEVARRSGLKDERSLRGLARHIRTPHEGSTLGSIQAPEESTCILA